MQTVQDNLKKDIDQQTQQKSPFLVVSTEQIRNIAENITQPIHANEEQFIESLNQKIKNKQSEIELLQQENTKLKSSNKQLIRQLQIFSKKLDQELKRRAQSQQRKPPKISLKPQEKQSIQIQNLYKKIEIYKKEVAMLKAKLYEENDGGNKLNDYENRVKVVAKENDQLREEIKSLKKVIKLQEKGLSEIGAEGFLKITAQNDKMKEEIRKLRLEMDQIQRKYRTSNQQILKPKPKLKTPLHMPSQLSQPYFSRSSNPTSHKQLLLNRKKNFSDYRTKTEPQTIIHKESRTQQNQSELNSNKVHLQKIEKLEGKIRMMNAEKIRQREIIENLKVQILQKDKEVNYLREKTEGLRKIVKGKKHKQNHESKENISQSEHAYLEAIEQIPSRSQSKLHNHSQDQTIPMQESINKTHNSQQRQLPSQQSGKSRHRYPRLQQMGSKKQSSYKWNHHQFSSKIKQVQVYLTSSGSIFYIHARYQKGQPNKSSQLMNKKFTALVCSQNNQYIQQIRGGFKNSHLQYLVMKTSQKRVVEFGNSVMENECENFVFNFSQTEYPCALLGENDSEGVLRFGCFVERLGG